MRMPATYGAVHAVFSELKLREPNVRISTLLDLGAGPGTATWAASPLFPDIKRATLIERESSLIELGRKLAMNAGLSLNLQWVEQNVLQPDAARHDLVIMSYVIGELAPRDLPKLIERAVERHSRDFSINLTRNPGRLSANHGCQGSAYQCKRKSRRSLSTHAGMSRCCTSPGSGVTLLPAWSAHRFTVASNAQASAMKMRNFHM